MHWNWNQLPKLDVVTFEERLVSKRGLLKTETAVPFALSTMIHYLIASSKNFLSRDQPCFIQPCFIHIFYAAGHGFIFSEYGVQEAAPKRVGEEQRYGCCLPIKSLFRWLRVLSPFECCQFAGEGSLETCRLQMPLIHHCCALLPHVHYLLKYSQILLSFYLFIFSVWSYLSQ